MLVVAYALSPIDFIPDFIPVLGYLDDLLLVPLGLWLALRLVPSEVLSEARARVAGQGRSPRAAAGAVLVVLAWLLIATLALLWWLARRSAG